MFRFIGRGFQENILLLPGWATDGKIFEKLDIPFNYIVCEETSPKEIIRAFKSEIITKYNSSFPPPIKTFGGRLQRESEHSVIPAKAGIQNKNNALSGFPTKAFGNDDVSFFTDRLRYKSHPDFHINILGWSMGGFIAADLIAVNPSAFNRIILASMRRSYGLQEIERVRGYLKRNPKAYLSKFYSEFFSADEKENQRWFRSGLLKKYLANTGVLRLFEGLDYLSGARIRADFFNNPNVTFVYGENDGIAAQNESGFLIAKAPLARHIFIKGAGHLPFLREEFTQIFR